MTVFDDTEIANAAKLHALEEYPRESVGGVINGKYVRLDNIAKEPELFFKAEWVDGLEALIHSHPDDEATPSEKDIAQQQATAIPWAILKVTKEQAFDLKWFGRGLPA